MSLSFKQLKPLQYVVLRRRFDRSQTTASTLGFEAMRHYYASLIAFSTTRLIDEGEPSF